MTDLRDVRALLLGLTGLLLTTAADAGDGPAPKVDFNFQVRPILADRCFLCHGPDESSRKADLRLDLAEDARASGVLEPGEGELVRRITATDTDRMPPKSSHLELSAAEVDVLRRWVAEGAEYKPHWAFLPPPRVVPLPAVKDASWPAGPVDRFVLAALERDAIKPSPPASREDWLRRASLDLTGLPPTPSEVDAFLADQSDRAFDAAADRLLASGRFGERMAMEWIDVARYADSFGYQADGDTNVWPWRDWVIRAFNGNLPYDQFLTWQLAGDLLPNATRDQRLATAFNRLNRMTNEGGSIPEEWRNEYVSDRAHTFGTAMMALTFECTRCHDHKYDPLTMTDYYALGAFFNNIDEWGTYDSAGFRPSPTLRLPTSAQEATIRALSGKVKAAESALREVSAAREGAFQEWLTKLRAGDAPAAPGPVGVYSFDAIENGAAPNAVTGGKPGAVGANTLAAGRLGPAILFTGDDPAEFPAGPSKVDRGHPFSAAFWLKRPAGLDDAIVFHREAGTDTGFHGAEFTLEAGRPRFALLRFWPGNALAVRGASAIPTDVWTHVVVTYDGSGKASGVHLHVDGTPASMEVVRDNLTKNVQVDKPGFVFGERFRSVGLKGGLIDDLRLFDRAIAPVEATALFDGRPLADADESALREYYLGAIDGEVAVAVKALREARLALFAAETAVDEIMTMEEMPSPRQAFILARGAYDAPKDRPVGRDTPTALPPFPEGAPRDRLGLARWLTGPDHPLTARVAVNRYWQLFFGTGIVATTENFGLQGSLPTHPELLDWLARSFIDNGWDVKALCKSIVLSSTYRQRSAATEAERERDPDNLRLARGPGRRLSAEMLRDQALFVSGLLSEKVGGPPARPSQPPGLWKGQNAFLPEYVADTGAGAYRRSLYTFWRRTSPPPNMLAFDAPSREVCVVRRQATSTPLQPLVLMNDPQFVEAAVALGARAWREGGETTETRLAHAFRLATSRAPTATEKNVLTSFHESQREAFARSPEKAKAYLDGCPNVSRTVPDDELAAAAVTAGVILNLDATVTSR